MRVHRCRRIPPARNICIVCDTNFTSVVSKLKGSKRYRKDKLFLCVFTQSFNTRGDFVEDIRKYNLGAPMSISGIAIGCVAIDYEFVKKIKFLLVKYMKLERITISQENLEKLFSQATAKRIEVIEIRCEGAWKVFRSCLMKKYNFIFSSPVNIRTIKPSPLLSLRVLELSEINFERNLNKYFIYKVIQALDYIATFEYLYLDTFYAKGTCFSQLIDEHSEVNDPRLGDKRNFQCQIESERGELTNILPIKNILNFSICIRILCPILDYSALASYLFRPLYKSKLYILFGQIYQVGSALNYLRQLNLLNTLKDSSFRQI